MRSQAVLFVAWLVILLLGLAFFLSVGAVRS